MNNAARSRRFESCTHAAHVGNVAGNNANSLYIALLHDRIEPPRIFTAIKDDGRVAALSKCFDNPGADAALRSGDEISFGHPSHLASRYSTASGSDRIVCRLIVE